MYILGEKLHAQKWLFGTDSSEVLVLYSRYLRTNHRAVAVYDRQKRKAYNMMVMLHRRKSSHFLLKLRGLCNMMICSQLESHVQTEVQFVIIIAEMSYRWTTKSDCREMQTVRHKSVAVVDAGWYPTWSCKIWSPPPRYLAVVAELGRVTLVSTKMPPEPLPCSKVLLQQ